MATNDFKPFAIAGTANVVDLPTWLASSSLANGFVAGYAKSEEANRAIRQPSFLSAGIAEWVNEQLVTVPIQDDGNLAEWIANFDAALRRLILQYVRIKPTANVDVYVSVFTGNDANDGASTASPYKTIQQAVNYCLNEIELGPHAVTIHVEGGPGAIYNESIQIGSNPLGLLGLGYWTLTNYNGQVVINGTGSCFALSGGSQLVISGDFLMSCIPQTNAPNGVLCPIAGSRLLVQGVTFGNSPGCAHVFAATGAEFGGRSYTIAGGADVHWKSESTGRIICQQLVGMPVAITLQNTPAFQYQFAQAFDLGVIIISGVTFPGTAATGQKFYANTNSIINTQGAGVSYFPGDTAGVLDTGAQYV